jgi:hypothetical protein
MHRFLKNPMILGVGVLLAGILLARAAGPAWWSTQEVLDPTSLPADYAPVLLGQVKWMATNACLELEAHAPGGAGAAVRNMVAGFSPTNNYCPANVGQLKSVAMPFYDRFMAAHYPTNYPWAGSTNAAADNAIANLGQLKYHHEHGHVQPAVRVPNEALPCQERAGLLGLPLV